ncbi:hypothetical protein [Nocardia vulneris]|uniref:hypothetical protein n=1 Tax=Nocardia vulneris TaxID=1141657 RepID=UPI000ACEA1BA|nr:hypothetical protein [Nocardia vulneris]
MAFDEGLPIVAGTARDCPGGTGTVSVPVTGPPLLPPDTGASAIVAFETAYYSARDGYAARRWVADGAAILDAAGIQAGIDSQSVAAFCVRIQRLLPGLYDVQVREHRPGEPETLWRQRITTSASGGYSVITAITAE